MTGDDLREAERLGPGPPVPEPGRVRAALRFATIDIGPREGIIQGQSG